MSNLKSLQMRFGYSIFGRVICLFTYLFNFSQNQLKLKLLLITCSAMLFGLEEVCWLQR